MAFVGSVHNVHGYADALRVLQNGQSYDEEAYDLRVVDAEPNTIICKGHDEEHISVVLWNTEIVRYENAPEGEKVWVATGGYATATTAARMALYLPAGIGVMRRFHRGENGRLVLIVGGRQYTIGHHMDMYVQNGVVYDRYGDAMEADPKSWERG